MLDLKEQLSSPSPNKAEATRVVQVPIWIAMGEALVPFRIDEDCLVDNNEQLTFDCMGGFVSPSHSVQ